MCLKVITTTLLYAMIPALASLGGQKVNDDGEVKQATISSIFGSKNDEIEPSIPLSLKKCLKSKLGISDVGNLREATYVIRDKTYLGVDGAFVLEDGSVFYYTFVFGVSHDSGTWENAQIYRSEPMHITFRDDDDLVNSINVTPISSLAILPDRVLTNYLWEIDSMDETGWTKDSYAEWSNRITKVTCTITDGGLDSGTNATSISIKKVSPTD